ncbi:splicing factor, proline- and glutamine-rich-like isoform X2 [Entelurus aequoreus]|uniref:splicing factor, proline- and glutamine-rich-like isoform X2 n=1 Tax=Entelurus aequoreus TaxID=161455 RepID=UPI002B1DC305|nr:splicing factor, proline- and glutamine-rich-like isoform X2 [Entelurus aequoreus]
MSPNISKKKSQVHQQQQLSVSPQLPLPLNQPQCPHMRKEPPSSSPAGLSMTPPSSSPAGLSMTPPSSSSAGLSTTTPSSSSESSSPSRPPACRPHKPSSGARTRPPRRPRMWPFHEWPPHYQQLGPGPGHGRLQLMPPCVHLLVGHGGGLPVAAV